MAAVVFAVPLVGCRTSGDKPTPNYRTVQASPTRDTERAAAEHAKALAILDRCSRCYQCECVKNALCNPCQAEQHLQNALIADVRYGPAHNTLGTLYFSQQKLYLAAWEFEYASGLMPERGEPLNNLGLVYEEAGRLGHAIGAYEEAVDVAPTSAEYLGNLARAHLKQGTSFEEVRYLLEQVVFYDTRPNWVCWAKDQLGTHPQEMAIRTVEFGEPIEVPSGPEPIEAPPSELPPPDVYPELVNPLSQVSYEAPVDLPRPVLLPPVEFTPDPGAAPIPPIAE